MISFLLKTAVKSATVHKHRFISLTLTIAVASSLLVILSSLYINAESQLALELSGVPNMVVEPRKSIVALTELNMSDVQALKSQKHFWRNNIVNLVPVRIFNGEINGEKVKIAGTWFEKVLSVENETYTFGALRFKGWDYRGEEPSDDSIVLGSKFKGDFSQGEEVKIIAGGQEITAKVAGFLHTGAYWDDYVFVDFQALQDVSGEDGFDMILVGALIKPKDELAVRAELYGEDSLSPEDFEKWYCSSYSSSIAYTIKEVLPHAEVKVLRRITEVQEGIIRVSSRVFAALLTLTFGAAVISIFSAEKMYISSKRREIGIMLSIGSSRKRILLQLMTEIGIASLLSAVIVYPLSRVLVVFISREVFDVSFQANEALLTASLIIPVFTSIVVLIFVKRSLGRDVIEMLR